jgi:maleylpyruvate isomerase
MKLYGYFRSSASFRVRITLSLKGIGAEHIPDQLLKDGGQQLARAYRNINPEALVPTLSVEQGHETDALTQSRAIIEYLDELYPMPPLLPGFALDRCFVRSVALQVAYDIHPVNNLRVLNVKGRSRLHRRRYAPLVSALDRRRIHCAGTAARRGSSGGQICLC